MYLWLRLRFFGVVQKKFGDGELLRKAGHDSDPLKGGIQRFFEKIIVLINQKFQTHCCFNHFHFLKFPW